MTLGWTVLIESEFLHMTRANFTFRISANWSVVKNNIVIIHHKVTNMYACIYITLFYRGQNNTAIDFQLGPYI